MKKIFLVVAALAMLATSCTKDDAASGSTESLVSFTVDSPELQTRYGEGDEAKVLNYAFYNEDGILEAISAITAEKAVTLNADRKATIQVPLVEGRKYSAIFWASAPDAAEVYDVSWTAKTVEMATNLTANDESYDAFYNYTINIDPARKTHKIELRRPFAQINIATKDTAAAKAAGVEVKATKVEVDAYKTLTFGTEVDTATGDVVPVANVSNKETFTYDWAPKAEGKAMTDYDMLSMNYVLVNARELVDVTLRMSEDEAQSADNDATDLVRHYTTVPVQRNYRTYIVGNLLTTNNEFIIETNPEWEKPNIEYTEIADGVVLTSKGEYLLSNAEGLKWLANEVDDGTTFEGKTVKLAADITLPENENWNPIGDNRTDAVFAGTFDGQGHLISGAKITGDFCWDGSVYGSKEGWGLFSVLDGATVKNLKLDKEVFASYTVISGAVAGYAHDTTFENIEITNTKIAGYNWYTGGVVGWASGESTFKGINLANTTSVGTLWDSHGQNAGGIAGGVSGEAKITIEDCNIACVMDVINDVTSNYKWYIYRVSGMIIGNTNTTEGVYNTVVTATATNVTCKNVTVTYGDWMNYHYCQGYWNRGWGRVESSDYVGGIDHTQCNHPDGEAHYVCIPFDQLFGGGSNGSGHYPVKGLKEFPGVTVNYPYTYNQAEVTSASDLQAAIANKQNVKLAADVDMGTTQLALDNVKLDLNGKTLTTANNWGGMALKNGASIKNGTINHTSTVAAIKAYNVGAIENVTINTTCATADKTVTAIAVQQGGHVGTIKDVVINGVSQGIEVGYQATVDLIDNANVTMQTNGTANGIGLVISGGKVGKAVNSTFKGEKYGVTMHLKGVFDVNLELENCNVEGTDASIYAWDEKGISNTSGSLTLTYDATTTLTGPFVWDFEDECKDVISLNQPQ